jgi:hypothetical protein
MLFSAVASVSIKMKKPAAADIRVMLTPLRTHARWMAQGGGRGSGGRQAEAA